MVSSASDDPNTVEAHPAANSASSESNDNQCWSSPDDGLPRPVSQWDEKRKALNRSLLKNGSFDLLVIPFQVSGHAIDRVGRSLMARYLANYVERLTGASAAPVTYVARALGETARNFDPDEIFPSLMSLG